MEPKALIFGPTFGEYEKAVKINKGTIRYLLADEIANFSLDFNSIKSHLQNPDIIFICNPNNPTAFLFPKEEIKKIINKVPRKTLIVIDEAFMDFVNTPNNFTLINDAAEAKNIIVIRSFTKFFSMAGFRAGFVVGNNELITKLKAIQYPWSINTFAQLTAPILIRDKRFIKKSSEYVKIERNYLYGRLKGFKGIKVFKPTSNFIFCKIKTNTINSTKLAQRLGEEGILIRDCSNFHGLGNGFFRIAVKKRKDNLRLLKALRWLNL